MNAVITGARRGIGRAIVEEFAREGANIWACARRRDEAFEADMLALSQRYGVRITPICFDLSLPDEIKSGVKRILQDKEPIDVLVNNAGFMPPIKSICMTPLDKFQQVMQVNAYGPLLMTQMVARTMLRQGKGAIVNVASTAGMEATEGYGSYAMSKAALISLTQTCAAELSPNNIRVNAVAPGLTQTELGEALSSEAAERALHHARMHRMGQPVEIARAVYFLASDEASFITGQILRVDGGAL